MGSSITSAAGIVPATVRYPAILCAGLPRSGSTWTFNVVAELARLHGQWTSIVRTYSDGLGYELEPELGHGGGQLVVIKAHAPGPMLVTAAAWSASPVVLTARDPRDCVVSLMQAFEFDFMEAVHAIRTSAAALLQVRQLRTVLALRYEDGLCSGPESVAAIAHHLGLRVSVDAQRATADALSSERVRLLVSQSEFTQVPGQRLALQRDDPGTHWHPRHIGDGCIGKFAQSLTARQIAMLDYETRAFRRAFGYADHVPPAPLACGSHLSLSCEGDGAAYLGDGFSFLEDWGVWTLADAAWLEIPLQADISTWLCLELTYRTGPGLDAGCTAEMLVNGRRRATIGGRAAPTADPTRLTLWIHDPELAGNSRVRIDFAIPGVRSPHELAISEDRRRIGIGLIGIAIRHG